MVEFCSSEFERHKTKALGWRSPNLLGMKTGMPL